jgi:tetratricopeptide (TPR) repeat protein
MDPGADVIAYQQAMEAKRLAGETEIGDVERALIDALTVRYAPEATPERARLDAAYAVAMREVARRFPDDPDVAAMYAESIMVLRSYSYWTRAGEPQPGMGDALTALEGALRRVPSHPGVCHLYIHATEGSPAPERATRCADLLVNAMPGASHMQHMPTHTYVRVGRYADAVRVSQLALAADRQAESGGAIAIYPDHNLHMLVMAAAYDGQSEVAIRAARDLAGISRVFAHQLPLVLARFGQWEEILRLPEAGDRFQNGMLTYAQGLALLRAGRAADAGLLLAALEVEIMIAREQRDRMLLEIAYGILAAELAADAGNYDEAIGALERARAIEADSLAYAEPEDWIVPVRQVLGGILLDAGRPASAEAAYRGELEAHPENGWSLYGLHLALRAQGKNEEAAATLALFQRAWARADVGLRGSRF